jgi:hypothetical protein
MTRWFSPRQDPSSFEKDGVCMIAASWLEITPSSAVVK